MYTVSPNQVDVVVVGAGIAGLVAARDIARAGQRVCVIERSDRAGGRLRATPLVGLPVELGAESFATRGGAVADLLTELGLGGAIVSPRQRPAWTVTGGESYRLPASGALGIPVRPFAADTRHVIGLRGALALALEPWRRRSTHAVGASLADIARARVGDSVLAGCIAPVAEGVYSASPETLRIDAHPELSREYARTGSLLRAARAARASRSAAGGAVQSIAGGMSVLVDRLIDELRTLGVCIETGVRKLSLSPTEDGWSARWPGEERLAAAVVLAVPPGEIERLLGDEIRSAGGTTVSGAVTSVETIALVVDEPRLDAFPRGTGALISAGHPRISAKALTHLTAKWAWLDDAAPAGTHVLRLSYGSRGVAPATVSLDDAEAVRLALADAAQVLGVPLASEQVVAHARALWEIPDRVPEPRCPTGIWVTGGEYAGTGLASVVPHARAAARSAVALVLAGSGQNPADASITDAPASPSTSTLSISSQQFPKGHSL